MLCYTSTSTQRSHNREKKRTRQAQQAEQKVHEDKKLTNRAGLCTSAEFNSVSLVCAAGCTKLNAKSLVGGYPLQMSLPAPFLVTSDVLVVRYVSQTRSFVLFSFIRFSNVFLMIRFFPAKEDPMLIDLDKVFI